MDTTKIVHRKTKGKVLKGGKLTTSEKDFIVSEVMRGRKPTIYGGHSDVNRMLKDRGLKPIYSDRDEEKHEVNARYIRELDPERLEAYNFRLNTRGRLIISRMNSDNDRVLTTWAGFTRFKNLGFIKVIKTRDSEGREHTHVEYKIGQIEQYCKEAFYNLVDVTRYPAEVQIMYSNKDNISARSRYLAQKYFEGLADYGINYSYLLPDIVVNQIVDYLNQKWGDFFSRQECEFDLGSFLASGVWLVHIKTGSNSGYPLNLAQSKTMFEQYASISLRIFNKWLEGQKIDWFKLAFELGMRTERDKKQRVVMMAPVYEKPISAVINTKLDELFTHLPIELPRKYGRYENVAHAIFTARTSNSLVVCKDFDGFDKHIPRQLFLILRDWFKSKNNTLCRLLAFECDLMYHGILIVGPRTGFLVGALESGIGETQFIGSMIHDIIDEVVRFDAVIRLYQSDDTIAVTRLTQDEVVQCFNDVQTMFKMPISPLGKKTFISSSVGIFLQKVIDCDNKIFYNHEQRAFTNGLFRERALNTPDVKFDEVFGTFDTKLATKRKSVGAYLDNLLCYGLSAPSYPQILSFMYGKKSGFNKTLVEWGLRYLEDYVKYRAEQEQHKLPEHVGWFKQMMENLLNDYGWSSVTPENVRTVVDRLSGVP